MMTEFEQEYPEKRIITEPELKYPQQVPYHSVRITETLQNQLFLDFLVFLILERFSDSQGVKEVVRYLLRIFEQYNSAITNKNKINDQSESR